MRLILKNGIVYDPINKINGEKMDICIENGKIVEDVRNAKIIDVKGKLVLPGGIDVHSHIAGSKVNWGRLFRPEDSIRRLVKREENISVIIKVMIALLSSSTLPEPQTPKYLSLKLLFKNLLQIIFN